MQKPHLLKPEVFPVVVLPVAVASSVVTDDARFLRVRFAVAVFFFTVIVVLRAKAVVIFRHLIPLLSI